MSKNTYFLSTGEIDRQRLTILSGIFNPVALQFMYQSGLKPGMTVLEFGCGTGHMACEIAKAVGPKGRVIATDNSEAQLQIAIDTAKQAGVTNIEFKLCDVREVSSLNTAFDFAYGRWVVFFTPDPDKTLAGLYDTMAPGGVLVYQSLNFKDTGHFSYPHQASIDRWYQSGLDKANTLCLEVNLASRLYSIFNQLQFKNVRIETHQPILTTAQEKSVYRLGLVTSHEFSMKHQLMSEADFDELIEALKELEENDAVICGFFRNILVSGVK